MEGKVGNMEGPAFPALAVMDQKEPVGTADVVNITAKANDLPTWLELLRDAMKVVLFDLLVKNSYM